MIVAVAVVAGQNIRMGSLIVAMMSSFAAAVAAGYSSLVGYWHMPIVVELVDGSDSAPRGAYCGGGALRKRPMTFGRRSRRTAC